MTSCVLFENFYITYFLELQELTLVVAKYVNIYKYTSIGHEKQPCNVFNGCSCLLLKIFFKIQENIFCYPLLL